MPRFEGDSHRNCKIGVDYINKTVTFDEVGKSTLLSTWFLFVFSIFSAIIIPIFVFMLIGVVILYINIGRFDLLDMEDVLNNKYVYLYSTLAMYIMTASVLISLQYMNIKWRKKYYPGFMAVLSIMKGENKKRIINTDSILDNKYIIPMFSNIMLQYEMIDDFVDKIKSVRIINLYKDDPYQWFCVFEFIAKPVSGKLVIWYV